MLMYANVEHDHAVKYHSLLHTYCRRWTHQALNLVLWKLRVLFYRRLPVGPFSLLPFFSHYYSSVSQVTFHKAHTDGSSILQSSHPLILPSFDPLAPLSYPRAIAEW